MTTAYSLQAVLSLLCLKKELDPLKTKKNCTQYSFLQKTHHHDPQPPCERIFSLRKNFGGGKWRHSNGFKESLLFDHILMTLKIFF